MPYYLGEIRFNKSKNSKKKEKKRKRLGTFLVTLTLISLLISAPFVLFSIVFTAEPSMVSILNDTGFTNIVLTDIETFSPGTYNLTLIAEFAGYRAQNELSYYPVGTSDFQIVFTGPEGGNGSLTTPISKSFVSDGHFGLSMLSPGPHRYFTEHQRNPDYPEQHAKVYRNLDSPEMFLIGFENKFGGFDRDYNDMVFSLVPTHPLEIDSVMRSSESPNYDQPVIVTAKVTNGGSDIDFVILSYQIELSVWINKTMSLDGAFYISTIPAQPYYTSVNYRVYAFNSVGNFKVSDLFSYTVGDYVIPEISNVIRAPNSPNPYEIVEVSANVTEPSTASGVKNVTLWYTTESIWISVAMELQNSLWTANIPGQNENVSVRFFIEASDNAGNKGNTTLFSYNIVVPNRSPVVVMLYSPPIVSTGEFVDFDGSASYDKDGSIISYSWDFGDGHTASLPTVSHAYVDNGEYSVTLTVVDNEGAVGSKVAIQVIKNRPPLAALIEHATFIDKKQVVTFDASPSYDPDGTIVEYFWDFGDGTTDTGAIVTHSYPEVGVYTTILRITDDDGATETIFTAKTVLNQAPVAILTKLSANVYVDDVVTFNADESYDPDGIIANYSWDFGDGNNATGITVSNVYSDNGVYFVTLTVTDDDEVSNSARTRVTVLNNSPIASFTTSTSSVNTTEAIFFDASDSFDVDGSIVGYSWNFGDGTTGTGASIQHGYSQDGTINVTLTVTDNDGATDSIHSIVTVWNRVPVASFTESAETLFSGTPIRFDASASYDPDGTIVSYSWNFEDGTISTGMIVDHVYKDNGVYSVILTVTDNDGSSGSINASKNVLNMAPVPVFTGSTNAVLQSEVSRFDASSSYDLDGTIVVYSWDFGDGNVAEGVTVDHAYDESGTYTITLTVTDDDAASSSIIAEKIVKEGPILSLAILSVIGLGIAALTATLLYGLLVRRRKKEKTNGID
jgi:PKD repeat protein